MVSFEIFVDLSCVNAVTWTILVSIELFKVVTRREQSWSIMGEEFGVFE